MEAGNKERSEAGCNLLFGILDLPSQSRTTTSQKGSEYGRE